MASAILWTPEDIADMRKVYGYCPLTGELFFVRDVYGGYGHKSLVARAGDRAGQMPSAKTRWYGKISHKGKGVAIHRFAWMCVHGPIPQGIEIDHINGVRTDNRIHNLRLATFTENQQNQRKAMRNNKSCGLLGVTWCKAAKKFKAHIQTNKVRTNLGYYTDPHEAHEAYLRAKRAMHKGNTL